MNQWQIVFWLGCALVLTNATALALMRSDKRRAQRGQRRISERALFCSAAAFGALGGVLGMRVYRHKTRHWRFRLGFPLLLVAQAALIAFGLWSLFRNG